MKVCNARIKQGRRGDGKDDSYKSLVIEREERWDPEKRL